MKCEPHRQVSQLGPHPGVPADTPSWHWGLLHCPAARRPLRPSVRPSTRPSARHQPYLEEEVMKLFSTHRMMKAL